MNIILYEFNKRLNSTKIVNVSGVTKSVSLKGVCSTLTPTFILSGTFDFKYNYLKFQDRYYYIEEAKLIREDTYELRCDMDYLATFRSDILATTSYVEYSASNYDLGLQDTRFSSNDEVRTTYSVESIFPAINYRYIINYVTSKPTQGMSGNVVITESEAMQLAGILSSTGFNTYLENISKQFNGAYESLLRCIAIPFNINALGTNVNRIFLGGYDTGINGSTPPQTIEYRTEVNINYPFGDFRDYAPFTSAMLFLPAYGFLDINLYDFKGVNKILVSAIVDTTTGAVVYKVGNIAEVTATLGSDIAIGTISSNNLGALTSAVAGAGAVAGAILTGGSSAVVGAVAGASILGTTSSLVRNVGSVGSFGSVAKVISSIDGMGFGTVVLICLSHDTTTTIESMRQVQGLKTCKVLNLGSLSGYVETRNVSVSCSNINIKNKINGMLNGGIYIE